MEELLDFSILVILYFVIFYRRWSAKGPATLLVNTLIYIYLSFVLYFTLMPIITSLPATVNHAIFNHQCRSMNLVPFIDVSLGRGDYGRQIILNIIMTIPFGFLLPLTKPANAKLIKVVLLTFLLSFSIEVFQIFTINSGRASDITDIITNVTGGIIGYLFYLLFRPLTTKLLNSLKNPHSAPKSP